MAFTPIISYISAIGSCSAANPKPISDMRITDPEVIQQIKTELSEMHLEQFVQKQRTNTVNSLNLKFLRENEIISDFVAAKIDVLWRGNYDILQKYRAAHGESPFYKELEQNTNRIWKELMIKEVVPELLREKEVPPRKDRTV